MEELIDILLTVKPNIDYTKEKALVDDGIIDSLDIVSIISELSDAYGITVPSTEIKPENFNSASAIYGMVQRLKED
ncbi:MAG TPA: acyl carrier protein [Ruminococcaceae bacterium]|jgi:acyl carrier protein|nr:acyl carrier protein [Oscillospiraceae bacterium]